MKRAGFTLIELSIVLVIIGLIVGGVLIGRDMVKAAKMRGLISEIEQYQSALNTFEAKYGCVAGDCFKATTFFGTAADCTGTVAITSGACNGDGDGLPNTGGTTFLEEMWTPYELQAAKLLPGVMTAPGNSSYQTSGGGTLIWFHPAINTFGSIRWKDIGIGIRGFATQDQINGALCAPDWSGIGAEIMPPCYPGTYLTVGTNGHQMIMGFHFDDTSIGGFTTTEVFGLDSKLDDGKPFIGKMLCDSVHGCGTTTDASALYDGTQVNKNHFFVYRIK